MGGCDHSGVDWADYVHGVEGDHCGVYHVDVYEGNSGRDRDCDGDDHDDGYYHDDDGDGDEPDSSGDQHQSHHDGDGNGDGCGLDECASHWMTLKAALGEVRQGVAPPKRLGTKKGTK